MGFWVLMSGNTPTTSTTETRDPCTSKRCGKSSTGPSSSRDLLLPSKCEVSNKKSLLRDYKQLKRRSESEAIHFQKVTTSISFSEKAIINKKTKGFCTINILNIKD